MDDLLLLLQSQETELHHPGVRCTLARLEELLHPEFHEVGRSGRAYDRATVIRWLSNPTVQPDVTSSAFAVAPLGTQHALLTYRSAQRDQDGTAHTATLRSSIWERDGACWRLRYHQGTPSD